MTMPDPNVTDPPGPAADPAGAVHRIFISAAEPSADLHGASLINAVRSRNPNCEFVGVAGPRMVAAGCRPIFDITAHAAMLVNALGAAGKAWTMRNRVRACLQEREFACAVVIDSPTLHLPLADQANRLGIPVMYYIAPQLWAWGGHRIYQLRHNVRHVAAILPFEEKFFRDQGVNATFVGHPLVDSVNHRPPDPATVSGIRRLGQPVIGVLPGSRKHVVEQVLPGQLAVARSILQQFPGAAIRVSAGGARVTEVVHRMIERSGLPVHALRDQHREIIAASDLVLAASGTTTLEVAFLGKPMIVMYNASKLMFQLLGRWIVRLDHYSLPNILAGREIVPEFMPYYHSTEPIAAEAIRLLRTPQAREQMIGELAAITDPLRDRSASANAAALLFSMLPRDNSHH
ncbi:MAG: lipid-A-disaccharide synthase [Planctomycetota bacterium]